MQSAIDKTAQTIDQELLKELLEFNNWQLTVIHACRTGQHLGTAPQIKQPFFFCKNLNSDCNITEIKFHQHPDHTSVEESSNITISFTEKAIDKIMTKFNCTIKSSYQHIEKYFRQFHGFTPLYLSDNQYQIGFDSRFAYRKNADIIFKFISITGDDISSKMWNKLVEILPFSNENQIELELEAKLKENFTLLAEAKLDTKFPQNLENIVDTTTQLSEIQQNKGIFYTTAENLSRLGFYEQAKEILQKTILLDIDSPFYDDAAKLITNLILNSGEDKRKNAQESIKYILSSDTNNLSDLKLKLSLLGQALGNETFFYHLLPNEHASIVEELENEIFIKALTKMTETIYIINQNNQIFKDENQQLRERVSRLEAELLLHTSPTLNNNMVFTACDNSQKVHNNQSEVGVKKCKKPFLTHIASNAPEQEMLLSYELTESTQDLDTNANYGNSSFMSNQYASPLIFSNRVSLNNDKSNNNYHPGNEINNINEPLLDKIAMMQRSTDTYLLPDETPIVLDELKDSILSRDNYYTADFMNILLYSLNSQRIKVYPANVAEQMDNYYKNIQQQTQRYAFIPLNVAYDVKNLQHKNHWIALIIDKTNEQMFYLDPAQKTKPEQVNSLCNTLGFKKSIILSPINFQIEEQKEGWIHHCGAYVVEIFDVFAKTKQCVSGCELADPKITDSVSALTILSDIPCGEAENIRIIREKHIEKVCHIMPETKEKCDNSVNTKLTLDYDAMELKTEEDQSGQEHFVMAGELINLGNVCRDLKQLAKAKDYYEKALKIEEEHYGPGNIATTGNLLVLGNVCRDLKQLDKAKDYYEKALKIREEHYGLGHVAIAGSLISLGNVCRDLKELEIAKDYYERALKIQEDLYGPEDVATDGSLMSLGNVCCDLKELEIAKDYYERALKIKEEHYGPEDVAIAVNLMNLGSVYIDLKQLDIAKDYYARALKIQEDLYGPEDVAISGNLMNLGSVYYSLRELQISKDYYARALKIQEGHYGQGHFATIGNLIGLGNVYSDLKRLEIATNYYARASKIQEEHYGQGHVATSYGRKLYFS